MTTPDAHFAAGEAAGGTGMAALAAHFKRRCGEVLAAVLARDVLGGLTQVLAAALGEPALPLQVDLTVYGNNGGGGEGGGGGGGGGGEGGRGGGGVGGEGSGGGRGDGSGGGGSDSVKSISGMNGGMDGGTGGALDVGMDSDGGMDSESYVMSSASAALKMVHNLLLYSVGNPKPKP